MAAAPRRPDWHNTGRPAYYDSYPGPQPPPPSRENLREQPPPPYSQYHHMPRQGPPPPPPPGADYWYATPSPRRGWEPPYDRQQHPSGPPPVPHMSSARGGRGGHYPMRGYSMPPPPRSFPRGEARGPMMQPAMQHPARPEYSPPGQPYWQRPEEEFEPEGQQDQDQKEQDLSSEKDGKKQDGDPLALLAKVSSMEEDKSKDDDTKQPPKAAPPTSPLQRRPGVTPILTPTERAQQQQQQQHRQTRFPPTSGPKPITPTGSYYHHDEHRPPQYYRTTPYPARFPPTYFREWEHSPAVVERNSFDSGESAASEQHRRYYAYPPPPEGEYPPPWEQQGYAYPPARWPYEGPMPPGYLPSPHMPPPGFRDDRPEPAQMYAPYTYVQQPHLEEKTVLKKKFSWKHYPELERFLIANRDEYLKHSSKNYTAEQKQYNNWLTERLLEVAEENHYMFDPDDFNFVAIRDRIRCYYKSYVQTARKRGLQLPSAKSKKAKPHEEGSDEAVGDAEEHDVATGNNRGSEKQGEEPERQDEDGERENTEEESAA